MLKPGNYDPTKPDIELYDFKSKKRYGLKLDSQGSLKIGTVSQDDTVYVRNVGKRPGDFDEQRSWKGGRGIEDLSSNAEGFWDSKDAWTLTPELAHQTLLWRFSKGIISQDIFMPDRAHSMGWKSLLGTAGASYYLATSAFSSSGYAAVRVFVWIRKVGNPGTLTAELRSSSAGAPNAVLQNATVTNASFEDGISKLHVFVISSEALVGGTNYHVVLKSATTDNKNNHWEIGGYVSGVGKQSLNGSTWTDAGFEPYYRVTAAHPNRRFFSFFLDGAMYVVDSFDNKSTASSLWINGDRGKATGGTATTLIDTNKAWTVNQWAGAWVRILRGGGRGEAREILSNTATALTITGENFDESPNGDAEYTIYATEWFTSIASTGLGRVVSDPAVINGIVFFPQGQSTAIRTMVYNATTRAHEFDTNGANAADFIVPGTDPDPSLGAQIWIAVNGTGTFGATYVSRGTAPVWASPPADVVFTQVPNTQIGDRTYEITRIMEKDGNLDVYKQDGLYRVINKKPFRITTGIEGTPDERNGSQVFVHQQFVYFSWLHTLIRQFGNTYDDVGQDWRGHGLPDNREGYISSIDGYTSLLFYGVDAGVTGVSSVLAFDGVGTHEVLRGYATGRRIRHIKMQPCQDTRNRLWINIGSEFVFQEMPLRKSSPYLDSGARYQHEAVIESARIDMGTASGMPKLIKEISVLADSLGGDSQIDVYYQIDDDVHTTRWTKASTAYLSPESNIFLGLNNIRSFAYRLVIRVSDNTIPVILRGITPNGFARTPYKMIWTLRCKADNVSVSGRLAKPTELMRWLLDNARFPFRLEMRSQYEMAHKFFVTIHPPDMFPYKPAIAGQDEESVFTLVLEEV